MATQAERELSTNRKRRGVVRASITRLGGRVTELEAKETLSAGDRLAAQRLLPKLEALDSDFKSYHLAVVDLVGDDALDAEQATLDEHADQVADFTTRIEQLCAAAHTSSTPSDVSTCSVLSKRLCHIEGNVLRVVEAIDAITPESEIDSCLLRQYEERLSSLETELQDISRGILSLEHDDADLSRQESAIAKSLFDARLRIKRLLSIPTKTASLPVVEEGGVKLPKLSVPTFDGNVVCLRKRYDRPRLLHQAHVRAILEAPPLREGSGRELRRLHDTVNQHLHALKAMEHEPDGPFITSTLEMKLDQNMMFEWHKFSQDSKDVPHFSVMFEFLNLRAQASESSVPGSSRKRHLEDPPGRRGPAPRAMASYLASMNDSCAACKTGKHPLYACQTFKSLPHDQMTTVVKSNNLCLNCLRPGHMVKRCPSNQRCRKCQRPHHSLLRLDASSGDGEPPRPPSSLPPGSHIVSSVARTDSGRRHVLLMTSHVVVVAPDGTTTRARALLDSASSTFISEHLAQHLRLPRRREFAQITGIGGVSHHLLSQSVVRFGITDSTSTEQVINVEAVVLPKVTSDLPVRPVLFDHNWRHISGLRLADPDFGSPGTVDVLLGVDVFSTLVLHGRRFGPPGSPSAFETRFGWVLAGVAEEGSPQRHVVSCHTSILMGDDLLRRFWEVEERVSGNPSPSLNERTVVEHFRDTHCRDESGRFVVQLPRKPDAKPLGESRSTAVRRFLSLERSLRSKGQFEGFSSVIKEYFDMDHAEPVPASDLDKPCSQVLYLPMHAVVKASSTTTKVRAVFDASAQSSSGVSLNDQLLVGPTVHASLVDVLPLSPPTSVVCTVGLSYPNLSVTCTGLSGGAALPMC